MKSLSCKLLYLFMAFYVALWRSWLRRQSGNPDVVGSSPAGVEKVAVGRTFSEQIPLATHFIPPCRLNWVPGIR